MTVRRRIWLVINALEGGGAEKVFVTVAAGLRRLAPDSDLEIVLLDDLPHAYEPPSSIPLSTLRAGGGYARSALALSRRAMLERPDLILSFLTRANCASVLAGAVSGAKVIISERIHTSSYFAGPRALLQRNLVRALYPMARILAVSEGVRDDLVKNYRVKASRTTVIYNPVDTEALRRVGQAEPEIALPPRFAVAVGRLSPMKDYPVLLSAFAASGVSDHLVILGEGPERQTLQRLAKDLAIHERVHFCGFVQNPHAIVARARLYVSASTQEGFPNALVEAMAVGAPVISTDCHAGPAEILGAAATGKCRTVTDAPFGVLCPVGDSASLARALHEMNDARCAVFSDRGRRRAAEFSVDRALAAYARVITETLQPPGQARTALANV